MILVKTEPGQQVFKDRSIRLTPRQRSAFILFDGRRSVDDIFTACTGITGEDIDQLIQWGLLDQVAGGVVPPDPTSRTPMLPAAGPSGGSVGNVPAANAEAAGASVGVSSQQRYKDAYPVATQLTGSLGLRGFRLNLAVEGTSSYEELLALAPKIRAAVGPEKAAVLDRALGL